jgi:hypothetical protein
LGEIGSVNPATSAKLGPVHTRTIRYLIRDVRRLGRRYLGDFNRIHVMSGGAPKEVFALLAPKFEEQTGNKVKFTYASSRNCGKN